MNKKRKVAIIIVIALLTSLLVPLSVTANNDEGDYRHELSVGVQNIVKRAYQMTDIEWTPIYDIDGWNCEITYKAGVTYTGLPYGQPVYASYVPWSTSLNGFAQAVNDPESKMYTSYSSYDSKAPYYSCDCSAFVSWAWGLSSRQTTGTIKNYATLVSSTSYVNAEVGDCLCKAGSHVVLITDITYDSDDNITGIEISESTVNKATNYCCQKTWYGEDYSLSLSLLQSKYLDSGYVLYRCNTRDSVTYTHSCASPLEGDCCSQCGYGSFKQTGVSANVTINEDTSVLDTPNSSGENIGTLYKGCELKICAYAEAEDGAVWFKADNGYWFLSDKADTISYEKSAEITDKSFPSGELASGKAFPIKGTVTAKNEIVSIYAAIISEDSANRTVVQEKTVIPDDSHSYVLTKSELDNCMVFNELPDGKYSFELTVTERAYCPGGPEETVLTTTESSSFSVGTEAQNKEASYRGIDVSHHQGTIDWDTAAGYIDFAIIRCGYGDDLTEQDDKQWEANAAACERLGIPYGVYIYSYALTDEQALSEAEHVLRLLKGHSPTLPIYLDMEDSSISGFSNDTLLQHAKIFCDTVQAAGYKVGVYASYSWWTTKLTSEEYDSWSRWIAIWGTESTGYSKSYDAWQYTSSGSVSGISGNVDMDYWYGELPSAGCCHEYEENVLHEASCTESGLIEYTCTKCGYSYTETIQPQGHDYTTIEIEANCQHGGYTEHKCTRCGETFCDGNTEKTGHEFENGYCIYCGIKEPLPGDLNGDGDVTSADSVVLVRFLAGLIELDDEQKIAADINEDGDITSADAVLLTRFLAGIIKTLG